METDLHLQISQHQARLKHENLKTIISQLPHITTAKYFAATATEILVVRFTASTIWGLQKLELVGMVSDHYMFLIF